MNDVSREYFWGCELSRENPSVTWTFEEEEEDSDFLIHTLFLKHAVLGKAAVANERNIVEVETKNFDNKTIKHPILSLASGRLDMCSLDLSFGHENAVVFRLTEGAGPVHLTAQQLVEFPDETNVTQEESELECTEEEESHSGEDEEASPVKPLSKKRKASVQTSGKQKKGKMEVSEPLSCERIVHQVTSGETGSLQITFQPGKEEEEEEEMEDDEDEEEEISSEEEEMEESEESSPEKGKKKKVSKEKAKPKPAKKAKKQTTPKATAGKKKKAGKK